jgi:hypothetical protein
MGPGRKLPAVVLAVSASLALAGTAGAAGGGTPPPAVEHLAVSGEHCKRIGFKPNTDDVAAGIRATGVACRKVRRSIRRFHVRGIAPPGFDCRAREHYFVLSHADHLCADGSRRFSWQKY